MPRITEETIGRYKDNNGDRCLYCNGSNMERDPLGYTDGDVVETVTCNECGNTWDNVFALVDVILWEDGQCD